ncbi:putative MFS family arabinose efflux permease [Stackebrandtia albiflava]|uniref:Putative MFS family arabinose efflux permease n=1 Tax=Stackebrandtia albiflava TaxID=406432 RepID=A0A562V4E0_9ACTN|nr:MFS transporter [Stackebrandtia albiflava]TWJ12761.1 putative MFS family arabinose efflux permease [Stackebrandtia albiflava]
MTTLATRAARLLPAPGASRALAYATLASSTGRGLFVTASVIYFHHVAGLSAVEVGTGMTLAAVVSLSAGIPMGRLADRFGARGMTVCFAAVAAVGTLAYLQVRTWWTFVLVASVVAFLQAAQQAARGALIAGSVPPGERVRTRAYLRAVTNVGWMVGAPLAGLALYHDTVTGYAALIAAAAAMQMSGALLTLRVPRPVPVPVTDGPRRWTALRDRPYVALAALNAVLNIHYGVLNIAIPLWVVERTEAPAWTVAVLAGVNTVFVILLQVRASRSSATVTGAATAQRRAGLLLLVACALYALAAEGSPVTATIVLALGALVHVLGELLQAAGAWGLSFELAPAHAQGEYQGLYNTGFQIADIIAPALLTSVVIGWGLPGWLLFGVAFAVAGVAVPAAAGWAARTRPVPVPATAA